ncbi:hypothetical protein ABIE78_000717 [Sinorhizobium fredii]|uniref:DUF718 domain-containing protein n=1 Tax=Rhizobium fredii TaxID=380 RepID=UPI001CC2482E|nr:DUF718 domain-containing protein [Sinorhizobium fredii]
MAAIATLVRSLIISRDFSRQQPCQFLDIGAAWTGLRHASIIKTGEGHYCIVAEWESMEALAAARSQMIATLDSFRDSLEDLGGGFGVTDPASGPVVFSIK